MVSTSTREHATDSPGDLSPVPCEVRIEPTRRDTLVYATSGILLVTVGILSLAAITVWRSQWSALAPFGAAFLVGGATLLHEALFPDQIVVSDTDVRLLRKAGRTAIDIPLAQVSYFWVAPRMSRSGYDDWVMFCYQKGSLAEQSSLSIEGRHSFRSLSMDPESLCNLLNARRQALDAVSPLVSTSLLTQGAD